MQTVKERRHAPRRLVEPIDNIPNIWAVYARYAESYPILTPDEITKLVMRMRGSSRISASHQGIRNRIVIHNLRLVLFVVARRYRFCEKKILIEDMIQEGQLGLIDAAENFDPSLGTFANYAIRSINSRISRAVRRAGVVNLPERVQKETCQHGITTISFTSPFKVEDEDCNFLSYEEILPQAELGAFNFCEVNEEVHRICHRRLELWRTVAESDDICPRHKEMFFRRYGMELTNHEGENLSELAIRFHCKKQAVHAALIRILRIVSVAGTDLIKLNKSLLKEAEHLRTLAEIVEPVGLIPRIS